MGFATGILRLPEDPYDRQARKLESADVEGEVRDAVTKGDNRFVGVMGVGMIVPGVPNYHQRYAARYGVQVIPGTSDIVESDAHWRFLQAATAYAERYNLALLKKLPPPP